MMASGPSGVCSVVVGLDEEHATALLKDALRGRGLNPDKPKFSLRLLNTREAKALVLLDGDY